MKKQETDLAALEHRCTSSIGVVLFINHEYSAANILKWADKAMCQAKNGVCNQFAILNRVSGDGGTVRLVDEVLPI